MNDATVAELGDYFGAQAEAERAESMADDGGLAAYVADHDSLADLPPWRRDPVSKAAIWGVLYERNPHMDGYDDVDGARDALEYFVRPSGRARLRNMPAAELLRSLVGHVIAASDSWDDLAPRLARHVPSITLMWHTEEDAPTADAIATQSRAERQPHKAKQIKPAQEVTTPAPVAVKPAPEVKPEAPIVAHVEPAADPSADFGAAMAHGRCDATRAATRRAKRNAIARAELARMPRDDMGLAMAQARIVAPVEATRATPEAAHVTTPDPVPWLTVAIVGAGLWALALGAVAVARAMGVAEFPWGILS